jgi:XTP/dITP diphosphohydrolase
MQALVIATHNQHKTEEIRAILGPYFSEISDLSDHPGIPPADETGVTFEENATIKALEASRVLGVGVCVLSDDSGLEVDALGGEPGVYSARYSGPGATDASNRVKLLEELAKVGARGRARSARFRCVMVLASGGEKLAVFDGAVDGIITNTEKGEGGFGYDPIFVPDGYCETFGELASEVKNKESHRARALAKAIAWLGGRGRL